MAGERAEILNLIEPGRLSEMAFSCPSITPVCNAVYTSAKFIGVGDAPIAAKNDVNFGAGGTRILNPGRSSGPRRSRVVELIWRNPLSHIFAGASRPALAICALVYSPTGPSMAFHTAS